MGQISIQQAPSSSGKRLAAWIASGWFNPAIGIAFALGIWKPSWGHAINVIFPTSYLVAVAFLLNGLTLSADMLAGSLRHWRLLALELGIVFVLMPAFIFAIRLIIPGGDSGLACGFQLLVVIPTTLVSAVVLSQIARADSATALYLTVLTNLLAIILVPPIMQFTLGRAGASLDVLGTSLKLLLTVFLPTMAGVIIHQFGKRAINAFIKPINTASRLMIIVFILTGLSPLQKSHATAALWAFAIVAALIIHVTFLFFADIAARILRATPPTRHAAAICTSQKSLAVASLLFEKLLAPLGPAYSIALLPSVAYYVAATIFDTLLAQHWGRRSEKAETEPLDVEYASAM